MKILSPKNFLRTTTLALALPWLGQAAQLSVNGTCLTGSCSVPDSISSGSISGTLLNTLTLSNGDQFGISVAYTDSYITGSSVSVLPVVTYLGTAPSNADTISLVFYQNFFDSGPGTFNGTYTETIPFILASGTSGSGELFVDGQGVGLLSATGPTDSTQQASANLTGLTGNTLSFAYDFTFNFAAGDAPGTTVSSTPEPLETIPVALAFIGLALVARRRKQ